MRIRFSLWHLFTAVAMISAVIAVWSQASWLRAPLLTSLCLLVLVGGSTFATLGRGIARAFGLGCAVPSFFGMGSLMLYVRQMIAGELLAGSSQDALGPVIPFALTVLVASVVGGACASALYVWAIDK